MIKKIKSELEKTYFGQFNVTGTNEQFVITLPDSYHEQFKISVLQKENIRMTIVAEPEKFGKNFLHKINSATNEKKVAFTTLWDSIINNVQVFINGQAISKQEFVQDVSKWNSFSIKCTILPINDIDNAVETINTICGMMLSLIDYYIEGFQEGRKSELTLTKYERNPINRKICLSAKGYTCSVCGFNFLDTYGEIGKDTIIVHHNEMVSQMGDDYVVKPIEELDPVCPNCHLIIHKKTPPFTITEVKNMLKTKNTK